MTTAPHGSRRPSSAAAVLAALAVVALATPAESQGYRLRLDVTSQSVRYRGWQIDSIPVTNVVTSPSGGPATPDGFAVNCVPADPFCFYYQPGPTRHAIPFSTTATGTMWGFGITGLSAHGSVRLLTDFTGDNYWPGTQPAAQLIELYADYTNRWFSGRFGRVIEANRLGVTGFDGIRLAGRALNRRLELIGYGGLGLGRASLLPIDNEQLNPFNQFQLTKRQWVAGGNLGWTSRYVDASVDYERQVDRTTKYFISERTALSTVIRPVRRFSVRGSVDYDLAQGRIHTADATLNWTSSLVSAAAGWRQYAPTFQLWEIWAAFNTIPYNAATGSIWFGPWKGLRLNARGEVYRYDDNTLASPLVTVENEGWRSRLGGTYTLGRWNVGLGYSADFGPGAASSGWDGQLGYAPTRTLSFTTNGGRFQRPLELRYDESKVYYVGLDAAYRRPQQLEIRLRVDYYNEDRERPDAAAFSWNQTRLSAVVTFYMSSRATTRPLPPGRMPRRSP